MRDLFKFLAGLCATALLTYAAHAALGSSAAFVDRLESKGKTALGNAGGGVYRLTMERTPELNRVAVITGSADRATQAHLLAAVRAVPGMKDVRWVSVAEAVPVADEAAPTPVAER